MGGCKGGGGGNVQSLLSLVVIVPSCSFPITKMRSDGASFGVAWRCGLVSGSISSSRFDLVRRQREGQGRQGFEVGSVGSVVARERCRGFEGLGGLLGRCSGRVGSRVRGFESGSPVPIPDHVRISRFGIRSFRVSRVQVPDPRVQRSRATEVVRRAMMVMTGIEQSD